MYDYPSELLWYIAQLLEYLCSTQIEWHRFESHTEAAHFPLGNECLGRVILHCLGVALVAQLVEHLCAYRWSAMYSSFVDGLFSLNPLDKLCFYLQVS